MSERRILPRQASLVFYDLLHAETGERFGDVLDLSGEGLMALCDAPVLPGSRVALQMDIAARMLGTRSISFEAECRWCAPSSSGAGYACGMQVLGHRESPVPRIADLAATMVFDDMRSF